MGEPQYTTNGPLMEGGEPVHECCCEEEICAPCTPPLVDTYIVSFSWDAGASPGGGCDNLIENGAWTLEWVEGTCRWEYDDGDTFIKLEWDTLVPGNWMISVVESLAVCTGGCTWQDSIADPALRDQCAPTQSTYHITLECSGPSSDATGTVS